MSDAETTCVKAEPQARSKSNSRQAVANRRNSKKSTGPRTPQGKDCSKYNALKHGQTARSPLLPGEDAAELLARQNELRDDMQPRNRLEARLLDRIGADMFRSDRSELAGDARASARIRHEAREQAKTDAAEVLKLGEHLLWKPSLPLPSDRNDSGKLHEPPLADVDVHPRYPGRVLLRLEWTIAGCDWLLDQWAKLDRRLSVEGPWRTVDALRMIRLTGKHAIDLEDDYDVARVLLCSLTLTAAPKPGPQNEPFDWNSALLVMLYSFNCEHSIKTAADVVRFHYCSAFRYRLTELPLARLAPEGDAQARQRLTGVIEREIKRARAIRAELEQLALADAAEAPARLTYEIGPEGDKHRRYVLSNERLVSKSVNDFFKARNMSATGVFDFVAVDRMIAEMGPDEIDESRNDDAKFVSGPLPVVRCKVDPTDFVGGPLAVVGCNVETIDEPSAPNGATNDRDDADLVAERDCERAGKLLWDEVARLAPIRTENLRKLNVECRQEEQEAQAAARRIRRREDKKGQPEDRETLAPSRDQDASCDDDQILRNEANESVSGPLSVPGREPAPDLEAQIERVEAHKRLGDEIARRAMIKAENLRRLDGQWWREAEAAEAACRSRNRGG
jgi:hypothetical protein